MNFDAATTESSRVTERSGIPVSSFGREKRAEIARTIGQIDTVRWDGLVPSDAPHLRSGFLRALETSAQCEKPVYLQIFAGDSLVAVAFFYQLKLDLLTLAPRKSTRAINAFRARFAPNLLTLPTLTCGPIVTNCRSNVYLSPALGSGERAEVAALILEQARTLRGAPALTLFFEFSDDDIESFGSAFADAGFISAASLPGTFLDVRWRSLDEYTGLMRKAFRRTVVKDRAAAADLTFDVVDDFSEIADEAWSLYKNVVDRADNVLCVLSREFFRELAAVEESRLVVARERASGKLVGIELLLCGETVLQDVFTGLDYSNNSEQRLYFNLIYPVIDFAGAQGFSQLSLGQTSYTFKSRLGVGTYPLTLFVRHRNPIVQRILRLARPLLEAKAETTTHKVFRDESPE